MKTKLQITISVLFLCFGNWTFSQGSGGLGGLTKVPDYDEQLRMVYGDEWMSVNADAVEALKLCFSTRITYLQEPLTTNDKYPLLSSFPLMNKNNPSITAIDYPGFDPQTFIPITYNLPFFSDMKQVIRVDGTNYIIVIDPVIRN